MVEAFDSRLYCLPEKGASPLVAARRFRPASVGRRRRRWSGEKASVRKSFCRKPILSSPTSRRRSSPSTSRWRRGRRDAATDPAVTQARWITGEEGRGPGARRTRQGVPRYDVRARRRLPPAASPRRSPKTSRSSSEVGRTRGTRRTRPSRSRSRIARRVPATSTFVGNS